MSRSLAPSPTAAVWDSGTPASAENRRSASALAARWIAGPDSRPVSLPAGGLQGVGRDVADAELGGQRGDHLEKAAADDPELVAEPAERADQGARARGQPQFAPEPRPGPPPRARPASPTRSRSDAAKSSSPRMAAVVTSATSRAQQGPGGQQVGQPRPGLGRIARPSRSAAAPGGTGRRAGPQRRCPGWPPPGPGPRAAEPGAAEISISMQVTGRWASRPIRSMFAPLAAIRPAMAVIAAGVSGLPSRVT